MGLKVRTQRVPRKGIELRLRATLILNHITHLVFCKGLMRLKAVSVISSDVEVRCQSRSGLRSQFFA